MLTAQVFIHHTGDGKAVQVLTEISCYNTDKDKTAIYVSMHDAISKAFLALLLIIH